MSSESRLQMNIRLALGNLPYVAIWRNNTGFDRERKVRYGLQKGSADLIGLVEGRFLSLEVKTHRGRVSEEQRQWRACVNKHGGYAVVVRSVQEALLAVEAARNGEDAP